MKKEGTRCTAVVLAAGTGSRMKAKVAKQFLELAGRPLIYYALQAVERSEVIDDCVLVTGEEDIERMQREIVERFGFQKVKGVIVGGTERCFSVANAMRWIAEDAAYEKESHYVFIHDGARPFLSEDILERTYRAVMEYHACVAAVPSKDTVKIADEKGFAEFTPERKRVWCVQTPQVFERDLIVKAYADFEKAADMEAEGKTAGNGKILVTDDASVVELFTDRKVKLVEGSYYNMKVTTPEDLLVAEAFMAGPNEDGGNYKS